MSNQKLNILVVGGSRHIGYHAALRFLEAGANVTFLLRNPNCFDGDDAIQKHVSSGKARLVKGDALILEDVRKAWEEAEIEKPVDVLLFTVGFTGNSKFHVTKGFQIDPPNIVTQCLLNCLCTMPRSSSTASIPTKVIITSASGVSPSSRKATPLVLRLIMYSYLISGPLADKLCCERIISYCAGWEWDDKSDGVPDEENILGKGWKDREGLPHPGQLKDVVILRPALLNDGECRADQSGASAYRSGPGEVGGWSVSRKDTAHFVFEMVTKRWDELGGKQVSIAY